MQQPQQGLERFDERLTSSPRFEGILLLECRLNQLKIPVAVLMPDKLVHLVGGLVEAVLLERVVHLKDTAIQTAQNPPIRERAIFRLYALAHAIKIHQKKWGCVLYLLVQLPVGLML